MRPRTLPSWVSQIYPHGEQVTQIWNVIEGNLDERSIFIFDCVLGSVRSHPCTVIACEGEGNSVAGMGSVDRILKKPGWTVLHGSWLLWFSWTMGTRRIERHLDTFRLGHSSDEHR